MDERRPNRQESSGRDMDRAAVERRRAALRARRKKQKQMRMLVYGVLILIAILVVILLVKVVSLFVGSGNADKQKQDEPAVTASAPAEESPSPEPTPEPSPTVLQEKVNTTQIDISDLSTENHGWGYGPSRNELNQPVDAVQYQQEYGDLGAYFVRTSIGDDKVIYLTSDEGYEYGCTPRILDALAETDTKIVFFVTMPFVKEHPDLVQRMIDEGHIVGSHSVTHPSQGMPSLSVEEQQNELTELHQYVKDNFNYEMWLFRPPTGAFSEQSLAIANNLGYRSVLWSFAHMDYDTENQPDPTEALQKCLDSLHPGAIYLLHAVSETNTAILKDFINGAKEQGYRFELLPANDF